MLNSKRVCYVVDDDADDQEIFLMAIDVIKDPGFQVKMFSRAKEFLSEIQQNKDVPDFVFMDINMPEMDGFECLTYLQTLKLSKKMKLIVVSTSNSMMDIQRAKSLGAASYIVKPLSIVEYTQLLKKHLN